jgi:hypothetical protein
MTQTETNLEPQDLLRNKKILLAFFLFSLLNGAVRKWVFAGSSGINGALMLIQLAFPIAGIYYMKRTKSFSAYQPMIPFIFMLVGMALNPMNQSIFHGFFGIMLHLGFWFAMLTYLHERNVFPIEDLMKPFLIICFCEIILTFIQFGLPADHVLNRYESGDEVSGFAGGMVRVIGTFSYIGGYGGFLFFTGFFVWALMIENKKPMPAIYGLAFLGLVSCFMNGSRTIVLPFILVLFFGFISYGSISNKIKSVGLLLVCVFFTMVYDVEQKFPNIGKAYEAFMFRVTSGNDSGENDKRSMQTFLETTEFRGAYPLLGIGLGATYQGAIASWGKSQELKDYGYYEEEPERILIEGGYALLIFRALLFIYFMMKSKIPKYFSAPILFYTFFFTQMTFSTFQSTFTFFGLLVVDKMYYLKGLTTDEESIETEIETEEAVLTGRGFVTRVHLE